MHIKGFALLLGAALIASNAFAAPIMYVASLSGPNESPPNSSTATGFAIVTFDSMANTMRVEVSFSGITTGTTASHIHCCTAPPFTGTAGVATTTPTFPSFPLGVTSGTYDMTFDLTLASSWNSAFISAHGGTPLSAEAALAAGLSSGEAYLNIHSNQFPGGEIRGFLVAAPEPETLLLAGTALAGLVMLRRKRT
jgi:CHRD domain/PEP-CTERM motif